MSKQNQKWYNNDCYVLKNNLRNLGNLLTMYPDDLFFAKKKEYKRFVKKQKKTVPQCIVRQNRCFS